MTIPSAPVNVERFRITAETPEEEAEVLAIFFDLAEKNVKNMEIACHDGKKENWKSAAHYLKGSAANLGMNPLAEACKNAELCQDFTSAQASTLLHAIRSEMKRVRDYFQT